jgi:hypothetical protein
MSAPNANLLVSGSGAIYMQNLAVQGNNIIATNTDGSVQFVPNGTGVIGFGDVGFSNGVISTSVTDLDLVLSPNGTGAVKTGNLQLTGNTISTTNVDGDLLLVPNGTGTVKTGNLQLTGNTISSTDTNGDLLLVPNGSGNVGIGTASPAEKLDVEGTLRHQGLTLNEGTTPNVDEIKTFTKNLSVSTSWIDTGIIGTDLSDGSYVVQLFDNINSGLGHYSMIFTGIMSWYSSNVTGDTAYNEILLHNAGHAVNGNPLFLRTQMQHTPGYLKLQIRCATNSGSGDFTFKFRRMI